MDHDAAPPPPLPPNFPNFQLTPRFGSKSSSSSYDRLRVTLLHNLTPTSPPPPPPPIPFHKPKRPKGPAYPVIPCSWGTCGISRPYRSRLRSSMRVIVVIFINPRRSIFRDVKMRFVCDICCWSRFQRSVHLPFLAAYGGISCETTINFNFNFNVNVDLNLLPLTLMPVVYSICATHPIF